jgi:hypothetical protein
MVEQPGEQAKEKMDTTVAVGTNPCTPEYIYHMLISVRVRPFMMCGKPPMGSSHLKPAQRRFRSKVDSFESGDKIGLRL